MKLKINSKGLYWGLILTFAVLYLCVGFVSTLHSITFFHLANSIGLAVLLGLTYEIGQASVLFSILLTKNKDKFLPWALMILLTALQVTANVYASYRFMVQSGSTDWQFWQQAILIGVQASDPQTYQIIISWISGALLPIVALGMTALVAENIKMMDEEEKTLIAEKPEEKVEVEAVLTEENIVDLNSPEVGPILSNTFSKEVEKLEPQQFEKDFILEDNTKKSKTKDKPPKETPVKKTGKPKKAQELLSKEEIEVPLKPKRTINPLNKKGKKPQVIKKIEQINIPSKGEELIQMLEHEKPIDTVIEVEKVNETASNEPTKEFNDSIEVVDVKAVPKKAKVDKYGIPIGPGEHRNFDRI